MRSSLAASLILLAALAVPSAARGQSFLGKQLAKWLIEVNDKDPQVRRAAAFALGRFPEDAVRIVDPLLQKVADKDAGVRDAAATALGDVVQGNTAIGPSYWDKAKPILRQALARETDERALRGQLYAIGSFGSSGAALLEAVQAKLNHKNPAVRQNAAWALGRMGEKAGSAVDDLIARLSDDEPLVRRDAATALGDIGLPAARSAVSPLLRLVEKEDDEVVKKTALDKLTNLVGPGNKGAAKLLYPLLDNDDPETAHLAAFVLAKIGGDEAQPALRVLRDALKDEEPSVQSLAAASLGNLGPLAALAVPELGYLLRHGTDTDARRNCAIALAQVGPEAKGAIPDIVAVLKADAPVEVLHFSVEALARMRVSLNAESQQAIVEVIVNKVRDKAPSKDGNYSPTSVRQRSIWALFNVEELSDTTVAVLATILDEKDDEALMVRYDAARALALNLGSKAPDKAAAVLLHMLRNDNLVIYNRTETKVSGGATESSSGGSSVKASTGGDARFLAAQALTRMGKTAKNHSGVIAELTKLSKEAIDEQLRNEAKRALEALGAK